MSRIHWPRVICCLLLIGFNFLGAYFTFIVALLAASLINFDVLLESAKLYQQPLSEKFSAALKTSFTLTVLLLLLAGFFGAINYVILPLFNYSDKDVKRLKLGFASLFVTPVAIVFCFYLWHIFR